MLSGVCLYSDMWTICLKVLYLLYYNMTIITSYCTCYYNLPELLEQYYTDSEVSIICCSVVFIYLYLWGIDPQCFVFQASMIYLSPFYVFKSWVLFTFYVTDFGQVTFSGQFILYI